MRKISIITLCLLAIYGLARAADVTNTFLPPSISCTNQFIRSVAASTGIGTCATVGSTDLAASLSLTTPTLGVANATSINFGGTALANYVEAAWTPTVVGSATPGTGQTYSVQVGSYERIGRQVTIRFTIVVTSLGTAAGNTQIGGLPLTSANIANDLGYCTVSFYAAAGLAALNYGLQGRIFPNTSVVEIDQNSSTGSTALTLAQAGAGVILEGFCNYRTT